MIITGVIFHFMGGKCQKEHDNTFNHQWLFWTSSQTHLVSTPFMSPRIDNFPMRKLLPRQLEQQVSWFLFVFIILSHAVVEGLFLFLEFPFNLGLKYGILDSLRLFPVLGDWQSSLTADLLPYSANYVWQENLDSVTFSNSSLLQNF